MTSPEISVIVPLYNKRQYIGRCLDSILGQSLQNFEVLLVNDGSTDGSDRIVADQYHDSRIKLINQANAGPGAARNHGARLAQAPLLAFLDGDDAWEKNYLEESCRWFTAHPEATLLTWCMRTFPAGTTLEESWRRLNIPRGQFRLTPETPARRVVAMLANMLPSSTVVRQETFRRLGGYYDKFRCLYSEDTHLWIKVLLNFPVGFEALPLTLRYEDASELALNLSGVRPIEPFLLDPEDILRVCPPALQPLLEEVLAWRALKTASVYGYFGRTGEARQLLGKFVRWSRDWRSPYLAPALVGCTPVGGWIGALDVRLKERGKQSK